MPAIIIPSRWTKQPSYPVEVDWSHPSTRGLACAMRPDFAFDVANNVQMTVSGTKIRPTENGRSRGFGATFGVGATDVMSYVMPAKLTNSGPQSWLIAYIAATAGPSSLGRLYQRGNVVDTIRTRTTNQIDLTRSITGTDVGNSIWTVGAYNKAHTLVICNDGVTAGNSLAFEDGRKLTRTGTTNTPAAGTASSTNTLYLGNNVGLNRNLDGAVGLALVWSRFLSDAEALDLTRNPWQIFRPLIRRIYFDVATSFNPAWARNRNSLVQAGMTL